MEKRVVLASWVVAVDPGKTWGAAVWRPNVYADKWTLEAVLVETGLPTKLRRFVDYNPVLFVEGNSYGPANTHIQRCVGRMEGLFGVEALKVSVAAWRKAVWGPFKFPDWKLAAMDEYYRLGFGKVRDIRKKKQHHGAEATLMGWAYVHGKIPQEKVH